MTSTELKLSGAIFGLGLSELLNNGFDADFAISAMAGAVGEAFSVKTAFGSLPSYVLLVPIRTSTGPMFLPHSVGYGADSDEDLAAMSQHAVLCAMNHPQFDPEYYGLIIVNIGGYCDRYATSIMEGLKVDDPEVPPDGSSSSV